ncbi:MAG: substrate-binding domain-containing protein, partial [Lachnospiraceae bacterium]|nr:substrate-binding domain-containing protein [Lachnospiraceae bacterium]
MKKKVLSTLLSVAMVATLLVGCGAKTEAPAAEAPAPAATEEAAPVEEEVAEEAPAADGELISVGIINNDPNESGYRTANDADLKKTFCEENGYSASFAYSLKNDEQIAAAQQFIQDGVDYLLLSAADTAGWDSVLKDAQDAGVEVILFDRTIDADPSLYLASIVSDMAKEGENSVNWLLSQGKDELNVIHIQGVMGSAAQKGRSGALDEAAAAGKVNIV